MEYQTIIVEEKNAVGYLTFNRPKQLNSFNETMHQEVSKVIKAWAKDSQIRAVVISAEGRGFCAGQDLNDRVVDPNADAPDLGLSIEKYYNPLIKLITEMPKPVICAVNGVAAGAGANIALACDIVVAAKSASFIQAFCRLGLVPDSGGGSAVLGMVCNGSFIELSCPAASTESCVGMARPVNTVLLIPAERD